MPLKNSFITVEEVVANAATILPTKGTDGNTRNVMRQWVYLGERQLGFSGLHEKTEFDIPVVDLSITKPRDYAIGIDLSLWDINGNELSWHYQGKSERIHTYPSFINSPSGLPTSVPYSARKVGVGETPDSFKLDSYGESVTHANVRYYSYPIDVASGDMLIPEHHMLALMMFCKWMFYTRDAEDKSMIALAKQDWLMEQTKAKSKNKIPSMLEGRDITRHHMSMIDKVFYEKY